MASNFRYYWSCWLCRGDGAVCSFGSLDSVSCFYMENMKAAEVSQVHTLMKELSKNILLYITAMSLRAFYFASKMG